MSDSEKPASIGTIDPNKLDEHRAKIGRAMANTSAGAAADDAGIMEGPDGARAQYLVEGFGVFVGSEAIASPIFVAFDDDTAALFMQTLRERSSNVEALRIPLMMRPVRISRMSWVK